MPKIPSGNSIALGLAVPAPLAFPAQHADAGGRRIAREDAWSPTTVTPTPGVGRTAIYTGAAGRTYSAATTHYNDGGGKFGRTTTLTGPGVKTGTTTLNRCVSNGAITDTRTAIGFNGATLSETVTRAPGQSRTVAYMGRNERTHTSSTSPQGDR